MSTEQHRDGIDTDVVIVGYGPVGATLAILLAQRGHRVTVVERFPEPYPLPRAVHFDHEVGRIFQSCGIGDELRAISEPAEVYEWRNAEGVTLLRFGSPGDGPSGWPASSMFNQPMLERLLDQRAIDLGVDVRRGVTVTGVEQTAETVTAHGSDGSSVRGRFLVGCDGANSTVRSLLGIPVTDLGFFYDWLIVDVLLDEPRVFDPINLQICDPVRPTTAVSAGPGRRRWEFMRLPDETVDSLHVADRAWELLAPWDVHPGNARLERHALYTFNARYATQWRAGRVLLAGDAAHLMPPFAGQGMCSGVRDAANLAWKLSAVLDGAADDAVLDSYQLERLPSVTAAIEFSMALGKVICVPDPGEAAQRDAAMAAGVGDEPAPAPGLPDIDAGLIDLSAPHAGRQLVQGCDGGRRFDDLHGNGWRLVTIDRDLTADQLAGAEAVWFESIGGRVVVLTDPDPMFRRWFADHATTVALQRPDFYLYGTAADASGAAQLITNLRHALTTGATT
jgi:2-polyprenyl-6-methoxyphenol hydroxylase-like FAD-dependent oxidoreductase